MARAPERDGHVVLRARVGLTPRMSCSRAAVAEVVPHAIHHTKRRRVPDRRLRSTFDQPASGVPLAETNCIVQWRATGDHCSRRFDVSASLEQRVERLNIVAAGWPVQRCLFVWSRAPGVDIGAGRHKRPYRLADVWKVTGPINSRADERIRERLPIATGAASNRRAGKFTFFTQQPPERVE